MTAILLGVTAVLVLPLLGTLYRLGKLPPNFFQYPIISGHPKPPFSWIAFGLIGFCCLVLSSIYLIPRLWGFKRTFEEKNTINAWKKPIHPPTWFWIGLVGMIFILFVMWGHLSRPAFVAKYGSTFFYWSLFLILDAWLYCRNDKKSILADNPQKVAAIAVSSSFGWIIYAYLNFFLDENWYYPFGNLITSSEFILYLILASSALAPLIVVTYLLLKTFPLIAQRFSNGLRIKLHRTAKIVILILSLILCFFLGLFPHQLFFFVWLGPLSAFAVLLELINIPTPFSEIGKKGNWSFVLLISLAGLIQGFIWEGYNYLSAKHESVIISKTETKTFIADSLTVFNKNNTHIIKPDSIQIYSTTFQEKKVESYRPDYWIYNVPYVNRFFVFEMPVEGLYGYLPYGAYVWIWWIIFAFFLNISPKFEID